MSTWNDESQSDLREDLDDLHWLVIAAGKRLTQLLATLPERGLQSEQARLLRAGYAEDAAWITSLLAKERPLKALYAAKACLSDRLRERQSLLAATLTAGDWQSPSLAHSLTAQAGRQAGAIRANVNDYKRDRHLDAEAYERAYVEELVDASPEYRPEAFLTSCGMATFTTILELLQLEGRLKSGAVAGRELYHESKELLRKALGERLIEVDELDSAALVTAIQRSGASVLFLDTLSNTCACALPNLPAILSGLAQLERELTVVLDNTGLSLACQPFTLRRHSRLRLLVFESLLKHAQLGFDRTNAGIILATAQDVEPVSHYRERLGTNISDYAACALPPPKRLILERRLRRLGRNASLLAARLAELSAASVIHPSLPDHPARTRAAELVFAGSCITLPLSGSRAQRLIDAALAEARTRGLELVAGASFGFDTTRIYLTAAASGQSEPFLRIAAGSEHRFAVEALAEALSAAWNGLAYGRRRNGSATARSRQLAIASARPSPAP